MRYRRAVVDVEHEMEHKVQVRADTPIVIATALVARIRTECVCVHEQQMVHRDRAFIRRDVAGRVSAEQLRSEVGLNVQVCEHLEP